MYCPYCGHSVDEKETYCVSCGKQLPPDMNNRKKHHQKINKQWYIPALLLVVFLMSFFMYHLFLENRISKAKSFYEQGEELLLEGNETQAQKAFKKALAYKSNFPQAETAANYTKQANIVHNMISNSNEELNKNNYQKALTLLDEAEKKIKNYTGPSVNKLITNLTSHRNNIKIEQLNSLLEEKPSIEELKILLWEADAIKTEDAEEITKMIRENIVDYTFVHANKMMNDKQFNSAKKVVEDGLKYAPESKKLKSLQTSIEKEKMAFEAAVDQRIEQALNTENNESDAVTLDFIEIDNDYQGNIIVKGQLQSIATVPIHSVKINYTIVNKNDEEIINNNVFVYPETLAPHEDGKFEFTHYELNENINNLDIHVNKTSWYTD